MDAAEPVQQQQQINHPTVYSKSLAAPFPSASLSPVSFVVFP